MWLVQELVLLTEVFNDEPVTFGILLALLQILRAYLYTEE